jgi:hypothetical protein
MFDTGQLSLIHLMHSFFYTPKILCYQPRLELGSYYRIFKLGIKLDLSTITTSRFA